MAEQQLNLEPMDQAQLNAAIQRAQAYVAQQAARLALAVEVFEANGIQSDVDMERANEVLGSIASARRTTEDNWESSISFFNKAHKTLTGWRKKGTDAFDALRRRIEAPMKDYMRAQEEVRRQQQAEADRAARILREQKEAEARRLAKQGEIAASREVKEMAAAIVAPVLPTNEVRLEGNVVKRPWVVTVTDKMALVKAIAEGKAPLAIVKELDVTLMKRQAADRGVEGELYPGVEAKQDIGFAVRA